MPSSSFKLVHVSNVEEVSHSNYLAFLTWHFTCRKCAMRQKVNSGAANISCIKCHSLYTIKSNGEVHIHENTEVSNTSITTSSASRTDRSVPKASGFLAGISAAVAEANEIAHGRRLREGLASTGAHLKGLDPGVLESSMSSFVEKCQMLERESINWSQAGRIKMGRDLQVKAKQVFDFDQAESYSLWLAGAWLESGERLSPDAEFVHETLKALRERL